MRSKSLALARESTADLRQVSRYVLESRELSPNAVRKSSSSLQLPENNPNSMVPGGSDSGMALIKNKLLKLINTYVCQNTAYAVLERDTSPQVFETAPAPRGPSPRSLIP